MKERNRAVWKSQEVTEAVAQDRKRWSGRLEALCAYTGAMRHDDDDDDDDGSEN